MSLPSRYNYYYLRQKNGPLKALTGKNTLKRHTSTKNIL
jgi:hypothetical protein